MKKCACLFLSICILFLLSGQTMMAQNAASPAPPPPPAPASPKNDPVIKGDQNEIIIRQKGDKDSKIVLEIKNGEYFINGKPLEKFDDQNLIVEKRELDGDSDLTLSYSPSPFRMNPYNEDRMRDVERDMRNQEFQRDTKRVMVKMNMAFLGVSSRKAEKGGATVLEVTAGSPAEKVGIKKGDIITQVNDTKIGSPDELFETIHDYKPGDKVKILFTRDGKEQTVTATLDKSTFAPKSYNFDYKYNYKMPELNMTMPPMGDWDDMQRGGWNFGKPKLGIKAQDDEDGKGVTILEVNDSSAAAKAGLKKGDIIEQVDGVSVNSIHELLEQTMQGDRNKYSYKLKISRNGAPQEIEVKIPRKLKTADL
jgi:serine protease Do